MIRENLMRLRKELPPGVKLVAVSKFHPVSALMEAYEAGQKAFGENRPQELAAKAPQMPEDAEWHFIGHLQTNKLKLVLPHVSMVQSIDSVHLLEAVQAWCASHGRVLDVLLELHLGAEETKQGFAEEEIWSVLSGGGYESVRIRGLMGMATHTEEETVIRADFQRIAMLFSRIKDSPLAGECFTELSIGMSADYRIALDYGATIVRIGSSIFGPREY